MEKENVRQESDFRPYEGDQPYIFISYSHRDTMRVLPVVSMLMADGYRVWYDEGIDPGTEWDAFIAEHIERCGYFIAFMSENYLASDNCRDELNYVRDLGKQRLLVYLSDVALPAGMQMRLGRLQAIHKYTYVNEEEFYEKLYSAEGFEICRLPEGELNDPERALARQSVSVKTRRTTMEPSATVFDTERKKIVEDLGKVGKLYRALDDCDARIVQKEESVRKARERADVSTEPESVTLNSNLERYDKAHAPRVGRTVVARVFCFIFSVSFSESLLFMIGAFIGLNFDPAPEEKIMLYVMMGVSVIMLAFAVFLFVRGIEPFRRKVKRYQKRHAKRRMAEIRKDEEAEKQFESIRQEKIAFKEKMERLYQQEISELAELKTAAEKERTDIEEQILLIFEQYNIPKSFRNPESIDYIARNFEDQTVDSFKEAYQLCHSWRDRPDAPRAGRTGSV